MDYEFRRTPCDAEDALIDAWIRATRLGFNEGLPPAEELERVRGHIRADGATLRGVHLPATEGPELDGDSPVATFSSYPGEITMPDLAPLPTEMITDVTVRASHRRRGLLRRLMTDDLQQAHAAGLPLAVLTVSEATIYGRFGFGVIGHQPRARIDTSAGFALRQTPAGRVEEVDPRAVFDAAREVFERFHRAQPGSVRWPSHYRDWITGAWNYQRQQPDAQLRAVLHRDDDGLPQGFATFTAEENEPARGEVESPDLVAATPEAYLALVAHLASIDLTTTLTLRRPWMDDPLPWALADPRRYQVFRRTDLTWARVLDPVRCLEHAAWRGDQRLVLEIADPLGFAGGRFAVAAGADGVRAQPSDEEAELGLDADTLSSLLFGAASVPALQAAGRLRGVPAAVATLDRWSRHTPTPFSVTAF